MKKKLMAILLALTMLMPANLVSAAELPYNDTRSTAADAADLKAAKPEAAESTAIESETILSKSAESEALESETSVTKPSEPETEVIPAATAQASDENSSADAANTRAKAPDTGSPSDKTAPSKTKYIISYILNGGKNVKGNPSSYSSSKSVTLKKPSKDGYAFAGWYKDRRYKTPVTKIAAGTTGSLVVYAKWKKLKEYSPKSNSARITSCKGSSVNKITVKARVKKRLKSADSYYYLVTVDPNSRKILKRVARSKKKTSVTYTLNSAEPNAGSMLAKYAVAVKLKKGYKAVSSAKYVSSPEQAAANRSAYKTGKTKKGIQFTTNQEVERTGAKNTFLNLYASTILSNPDTTYKYNGKTYHFNSLAGYVVAVSEFNNKGINVAMQLCLDWGDGSYQDLIAPQARSAGHTLYTWNTSSQAAREKMEAMFSFLASRFNNDGCHVSNWILGNEVNSCNLWNYNGGMSKNEFISTYAYAFRSLYNAVKSNWSNAKVFICLDHCWNTVEAGYSAKDFLNSFAQKIKSLQSGINWNVAYHAYPNPLTSPDYWNNSGIDSSENSPYIHMENIQVLTDYIKNHYGSKTRVILSEQGFSSSLGQNVQAAAIAYGYYKAACNPMIDAFIIRSYSDEPGEMAQGLYMGINGKEAFNVFKYMDSKSSANYTNAYLQTIGKSSWKSAVPGYKASRIYKMYRK